MKIYIYDVPNEMILKYCRIIKALEFKYDSDLEFERTKLHDDIFDVAGRSRALYRRDDRRFNKALNDVVLNTPDMVADYEIY